MLGHAGVLALFPVTIQLLAKSRCFYSGIVCPCAWKGFYVSSHLKPNFLRWFYSLTTRSEAVHVTPTAPYLKHTSYDSIWNCYLSLSEIQILAKVLREKKTVFLII